ncbi:hypothetical protein LIER_44131 [Lithospermum erythrorhizon]|uniref:Uncharacterized protein n=1 Tax=Lithospermum erythrorhizon TaxID=34254 RepID=A0AAV3Q775_LITER
MPKHEEGIGFKELECMNLALLARQAWRIMTRQASLLYKVLKGRYFRNSTFLNAKVRSNVSYGWQSLLEGNKVLRKGVRWRVSDGKSIDIWKDPWVPRHTDFHMRGTRRGDTRWVSQFIKEEPWDRRVIEQVMDLEDANKIMAIPLSKHHIRDRLIWNHTKSMTYLTCSGYWTTLDLKRNGDLQGGVVGETSRGSVEEPCGKIIWRLHMLPRVKNFI